MALGHFGDVEEAAVEPDVRIGTCVQISLRVLLPFIVNPRGSGRGGHVQHKWFAFNYLDRAGDGGELGLVCK